MKEILEAALELDKRERAAFLDKACRADPGLRQAVESLLASDQSMGEFLEAPLEEVAASIGFADSVESQEGRHIGPYQVVREIGHGGMGTVYLAERADGEYCQSVAIKLVNPGLGSEAILRRFRGERQVLACLAHPNIARLLDGGVTAQGLPYLVMEYVAGEPIDTWCDARRLDINDRLRLFQQVCSAAQHGPCEAGDPP